MLSNKQDSWIISSRVSWESRVGLERIECKDVFPPVAILMDSKTLSFIVRIIPENPNVAFASSLRLEHNVDKTLETGIFLDYNHSH